jgi:sterol desaturase/sphingolipid hydroxylase (fatty acid hydroxylase superfamily)
MSAQKNFVSLKDETIQIFQNPFLDWCSRIHWAFPLIVWVPIMCLCLFHAIVHFDTGLTNVLIYFVIGIALWTLTEYVMHRFIFHYHPTSEFGQRIHFLMHGVHHDYPNDSKRLVMPPLMSIILAIPFFAGFYYGFGGQAASFSGFAGIVFGYLLYDMLHYAVHHAKWQNTYFEKIKKHHMAHHFVHPDAGFGVSNLFWDVVFRTELDAARKKAQQD